jgi:hypothetical protein
MRGLERGMNDCDKYDSAEAMRRYQEETMNRQLRSLAGLGGVANALGSGLAQFQTPQKPQQKPQPEPNKVLLLLGDD